MVEIKEMIGSYKESIGGVHQRVLELNDKISASGGEGNPKTSRLTKRRYLLYQQIWEMQHSVDSLQQYVDSVTERNKRGSMLS